MFMHQTQLKQGILIMKHYHAILVLFICLILVGCNATSTKQSESESNKYCAEYGYKAVNRPYCCKQGNGYCEKTCYKYEQRHTCIDWQCKEGYKWQEVKKEDLKWWQFAGAGDCVPIN